MLKHVLHGYRDADALTILRNCRAVILENGSLLVIEFILPLLVSQADPHLEGRLMSDINILAVTGGKERSEHEWRTLLEAAGFFLSVYSHVGVIWESSRLGQLRRDRLLSATPVVALDARTIAKSLIDERIGAEMSASRQEIKPLTRWGVSRY